MLRSAGRSLVLSLFVVGCLDVPPPLDAAGPSEDAGASPAMVIEAVALDSSGEAWPLSGVPRTVQVHVHTSVGVEDMDDWVVLRGPPDEALLEDLAETPLRQANQSRSVFVQRRRIDGGVRLELERLPPGQVLTLALLGRAHTVDGRRFQDSWVRTVTVSDVPRAGADVLASWPPDGASAVPHDLHGLVVRFDAPVTGDLMLSSASGPVPSTTASLSCQEVGWSDGFCLSARPDTALPTGPLRLSLADGLVDGTGAQPHPFEASVTVTSERNGAAPALLESTCALDEIASEGVCALLGEHRASIRLRAAEPVRAFLDGGGESASAVAPRGEVSLSLSSLFPDAAFDATLRLVGLDGQTRVLSLPLRTTAPLLAVTLTEVRSDPHGREPAQELLEVLNFGDVALDINGISISDRPDAVGDVVVGAPPLAPGARALLVGDDFDPDAPEDTQAPAGVTLIRVGRSLASGGLSNAGEPVYLRDAELRRLAYAPAVATGEGLCLQRESEADPRSDAFVVQACSPGRAP